MFRVLLI